MVLGFIKAFAYEKIKSYLLNLNQNNLRRLKMLTIKRTIYLVIISSILFGCGGISKSTVSGENQDNNTHTDIDNASSIIKENENNQSVVDEITTKHYQNINSSNNAKLKGDFTNWGADESQMDKVKMNSLIITAYPTTVMGTNYGEVTNINNLSTDAKSGDVAKVKGKKYIFSGLEDKWVVGYDLNDKNTYDNNKMLVPLAKITAKIVEHKGGTLYFPKGRYENQIKLYRDYNNDSNPSRILQNLKIKGDGNESILDTSNFSSWKTRSDNAAINIMIDQENDYLTGFKNIIISDFKIKIHNEAIVISANNNSIGDNILLRNINIIKTTKNYASLISFNKSISMTLFRITLDNVNTSVEQDAFCMHEFALFKAKYIKIHNCDFNGHPVEFNIDIHAQFVEISDTNLTKPEIKDTITTRPNMKFPDSNFLLFNKVHFSSKSTVEGNILISSSPEKYNLHFENCTFDTAASAIFTTYGHIGYGIKQLVLKNNKIIGSPEEFQIYGADNVYIKGNTKNDENLDKISPFTHKNDVYKSVRFTEDFAPLNRIVKIEEEVLSDRPMDYSIGYKSWNNENTNKIIRTFTLHDITVSVNRNNIKTVNTEEEFKKVLAEMNGSPKGGLIKIKKDTSIEIDETLIFKKTGVIGGGSLTLKGLSIEGDAYLGDGLNLTIKDKITVNGTLTATRLNLKKNSQKGSLIEAKNVKTKIIIHASTLSGGENIISGKAHLVLINGESELSNYARSGVNVSTKFLNIMDTYFKGNENQKSDYGIYVGDVTNLYLKYIFTKNINTPIYLDYHKNTKVIEIANIDSDNAHNQIVTRENGDSQLTDISILWLKVKGQYRKPPVTIKHPGAKYTYASISISYDGKGGTVLDPRGTTTCRDDTDSTMVPHHIPMGYFPAEWNYFHPNEKFKRP